MTMTLRSSLTATIFAIAVPTALTACGDQSALLPTITGAATESVPTNEGQPRGKLKLTAAPGASRDSRTDALDAQLVTLNELSTGDLVHLGTSVTCAVVVTMPVLRGPQ